MASTQQLALAEALYRATTAPQLVQVPELGFLCIDGHGDPNTTPAYAAAVQALYGVSYAARFAIKAAGGPVFKVSPLEGLFDAADLSAFDAGHKQAWDWTMMIRQPDVIDAELVRRIAEEVAAKKDLPDALKLRLIRFEEGSAAQILHIGPYAIEGPTIRRLHAFIHGQGFTFDGHVHRHHEIYLGDPRRSAPQKLRTIIRQPYAVPAA